MYECVQKLWKCGCTANGFESYFCKKKKLGEMDFAIETEGSVIYLSVYMCYLLKEPKIGKMIVKLYMDGL